LGGKGIGTGLLERLTVNKRRTPSDRKKASTGRNGGKNGRKSFSAWTKKRKGFKKALKN